MRVKKILTISFFAILLVSVTMGIGHSAKKGEFTLDVPLIEGAVAEESGDYVTAIEAFRKVLFVDGKNIRAQFGLAQCLEKTGNVKNALREYRLFIQIAKKDTLFNAPLKAKMLRTAQESIKTMRMEKKSICAYGFLDLNILVLTSLLTIFFAYKIIMYFSHLGKHETDEERMLGLVWQDREWLRTKEREIRPKSSYIFDVVMILIGIVLYVWSYHIIFIKT